jgi:hypothetical protein
VKLATQLLSQSTIDMICNAIADNQIVLSLHIKGMYSHVADLCDQWNEVVDICNGRDLPSGYSCLLDGRNCVMRG